MFVHFRLKCAGFHRFSNMFKNWFPTQHHIPVNTPLLIILKILFVNTSVLNSIYKLHKDIMAELNNDDLHERNLDQARHLTSQITLEAGNRYYKVMRRNIRSTLISI